MKTEKIIQAHSVLKAISPLKTPFKICFARNLVLSQPIFDKYNREKDAMFNSLVKKDEVGNFVYTDFAKKAIESGALEPKDISFNMFVYKDTEGEALMSKHIADAREVEVEGLSFESESLSKKIRVKNEDGMYLIVQASELIDSPDCDIPSEHLSILFDLNIITK